MADQRRIAAAAVIAPGKGYIIGLAEFGTAGYTPDPREEPYSSYEAAQKRANEINEKLGLSPLDAFAIVADTIQRSLSETKGKWKPRA